MSEGGCSGVLEFLLHGVSMKVSIRYFLDALKDWSERRDLNSGPLAPHAGIVFLSVPVYS
jgi:hypothetical protein